MLVTVSEKHLAMLGGKLRWMSALTNAVMYSS